MEELKEKLVEEITEHLDSDKVSAEYLELLGRTRWKIRRMWAGKFLSA